MRRSFHVNLKKRNNNNNSLNHYNNNFNNYNNHSKLYSEICKLTKRFQTTKTHEELDLFPGLFDTVHTKDNSSSTSFSPSSLETSSNQLNNFPMNNDKIMELLKNSSGNSSNVNQVNNLNEKGVKYEEEKGEEEKHVETELFPGLFDTIHPKNNKRKKEKKMIWKEKCFLGFLILQPHTLFPLLIFNWVKMIKLLIINH